MLSRFIKSLCIFAAVLLCLVAAITAVDAASSSYYPAITFGYGGNGAFSTGTGYGAYSVNSITNAVDIVYAESTHFSNIHYLSKIKFANGGDFSTDCGYMRVQYALDLPVGVNSTNFYVRNDASGGPQLFAANVTETSEFVLTDTFAMPASFPARFAKGGHFSFFNDCTVSGGTFSIKAIYFFPTAEEADSFVPDTTANVPHSSLTFGVSGSAGFTAAYGYGEYTVNEQEASVDIIYSEAAGAYMAKIRYLDVSEYNTNHTYMRVLYSLDNPSGVSSANLYVRNDASGGPQLFAANVSDTDGYVFSDTLAMPASFPTRLADGAPLTFSSDCTTSGGVFSIKGIYFFASKEEADNFVISNPNRTLSINGNNIEDYVIVIPEAYTGDVYETASIVARQIRILTGVIVPVVTDNTPERDLEILIGGTNRKASSEYITSLRNSGESYEVYCVDMVDSKPVITSYVAGAAKHAAEYFAETYLYKGAATVPRMINISSVAPYYGNITVHTPYEVYDEAVNVDDPTVFVEDFSTDEGYFTEENGAKLWKYKNGTLTYTGDDYSVSYVHVYEANVSETVTLSYEDASEIGNMGLIARYAADAAYVKAGYDFRYEEWYIEYREGIDLFTVRADSVSDVIYPDTEYTLNLTVDGNSAVLTVDGDVVIDCEIPHVTPGRIGVYADGVSVSVDDYEAVLLSGEGVIFQNAVHNLLPGDEFREGGSVMILSDNTWIYQNHRDTNFKSLDNGTTWERSSRWTNNYGYINVLRLNSGRFIQMAAKTVNGTEYIYARYSTNDGKTWKSGGIVCPVVHPEFGIGGGNMNDKLSQSAKTGRIFYSLNYDNRGNAETKKVFCEYYYSDDEGLTWNKSEMGSYDIEGADLKFFGENKLIECANGDIRMYCSWNREGKILYADSTDGGLNFGPLKELEGFTSSHASMQLVRDPYGPTDTTYYMVWVNCDNCDPNRDMTHPIRSRLSLAYSTDGKTWKQLGDIWRWECRWRGGSDSICISHLVDPFINVTEDYIVCGSGISEKLDPNDYHNAQRQHIWSIKKSTLDGIWKSEMMPDADGDGNTTLCDLTILNRYFANWIDYTDEKYDFGKFDLNGDGAVNPLDSVILARHIAGWLDYAVIPLVY